MKGVYAGFAKNESVPASPSSILESLFTVASGFPSMSPSINLLICNAVNFKVVFLLRAAKIKIK